MRVTPCVYPPSLPRPTTARMTTDTAADDVDGSRLVDARPSTGGHVLGRRRDGTMARVTTRCVCPPARESRSIARARRVATARAGERAREARMDGMGAMTSARHTSTISTRDAFAVSCGNDGTAMV